MTDREENARLKKVIYILSIVVFLLIVGFVAYLSYGLSKLNSVVSDNVVNTSNNSTAIKRLENRITKVESQAKLPGPQGKSGKDGSDGKNGKDSVSTNTVEKTTVVKQVPVKGDTGMPGREVELGKDASGSILWRYVGSKLWNQLEVVQ